jgi:predicted alpha-1,6-mannanase (GH76 family)
MIGMRKIRYWIAGAVTSALVASGVTLLPSAHADVAGSPDASFDAWNDAFLVRNVNGNTYYTDKPKSTSTSPSKWFVAALNIAIAEDAYQRTRTPGSRQLVLDLVTFMINDNGRDWTPNSWNDDMAWMDLATLRGYQASGNADWLAVAADNWNKTYNRGWNAVGGGGIWEDNNRHDRGKCALSNNPMITAAVLLYQATGDGTYLSKAESIYSWVRRTLVDTSTGQVNGCVFFPGGDSDPGRVTPSDNVYDAGSLIEAANLLYRITGNRTYYDDALRSADHIKNTVPIIHQNQGPGSSYQYRYFRGLNEFCTDQNLCDQYAGYMRANADAAWSIRNSANLMWNDWTRPTNEPDPSAFEMNSAVGLWQQLPYTGQSQLNGQFQLRNAASGQYVTVQNGSTANAVVQTPDVNDPSSRWTFTLRSNGHYEIRNVRSGQLLNVAGESARPGVPVVQWPSQNTTRSGNDQWQPIRNSDGTYSFYNRNSQFALDNPGGSTAPGVAYEQWPPNDGAPQRFVLVQP